MQKVKLKKCISMNEKQNNNKKSGQRYKQIFKQNKTSFILANEKMEGDPPIEKSTVDEKIHEPRRGNSSIPLKTGKPKVGTYIRSSPTRQSPSKLLNKATLERQFLNNRKRFVQMLKDLDEKQKPIVDLYKTLLRTKNQLESFGKIMKIDDVEIVKLKLNDQPIEDLDKNDNCEKKPTLEELLDINKDCLLKFENLCIDKSFIKNCNDIKDQLLENQELLKTLADSEQECNKIEQLKEQVEKERKQSNNLKDNLKKTEDEKENLKKIINEQQTRINNLEKELKEQKQTSNDYNKKLQNSKCKVLEWEKKLKDSEDRIKQLQDTMKQSEDQWMKERDKIKKKYNALQQKFLEKQQQLDLRVTQESEEIERMRTNYESKCKDFEEKIIELKTNNQQLSKEQHDLIVKNREMTENFATTLDNKQQEIESLQIELQKSMEVCNDLEVNKVKSRQCIEELRNLLKSCRDEILYKNQRIDKLTEWMSLKIG